MSKGQPSLTRFSTSEGISPGVPTGLSPLYSLPARQMWAGPPLVGQSRSQSPPVP